VITVPAGNQRNAGAFHFVDGQLDDAAEVRLDALDRIHLADGEQPWLALAKYPSGLYPGHPVDMPAEPDHLDLVGQQPLDRHYDRLGTGTVPLDDAAHGRMADPAGKHVDCLLLFGLEPLA
jgi:hypothetical protein